MDRPERRILIVDDSAPIHEDFRKILDRRNDRIEIEELEAELFGVAPTVDGVTYQLESAYQGQQALEKIKEAKAANRQYALAFVDMRMPPGWDGARTIEEIWKIDPEIQIVVCTAYADYSWEDLLARFGQTDRLLILKKPFDTAEVCQLACALTEKWHLARHAHLKLTQLRSMVEERTRELHLANLRLEEEVAERRALEDSLRISEARYALAAEAANDGLWDWDLDHDSVFYSSRWKAILGFADDDISDRPGEWFDRVHPDDIDGLKDFLDDLRDGKLPQLHAEYRMRHRDDQYRWVLTRGLLVRTSDGSPARMAGSQSDVTDRRLAEEQLKREALKDALTGLPNRALLLDRLGQCIAAGKRKSERFAILFLDLDRFKWVNDSLGHLIGDRLLIAVADKLKSCVRGSDSVGRAHRHSVARLGGDEFVILLRHLASDADALRVAERVLASLAEPTTLDNQELATPASIGIAFGGDRCDSAEAILRDADTAMYHAKAKGAGRYAVFNPDMHAAILSRWRTENELRAAISRSELYLLYQPVVDLRTSRIAEVEALLRWDHPELGAIPPSVFIPLAEETGLIVSIGRWVLQEACKQLRWWMDHLPVSDTLALAVNVSAKQISHEGFAEEVATALTENRLRSHQLRLEITESLFLESGLDVIETIPKLRDAKIQLHLDDFGTGYSSLRRLQQLPVAALKIDRMFVHEMLLDPTSDSIVQAIIALGHALRMLVVAEGVETKDQLAHLRELGCDLAQGYLFTEPLSPSTLSALLAQGTLVPEG